MIELTGVSVTYPDADRPVLRGVDLTVDEGELCLVIGPTGSGKSTLLGAVTGLVPHFTGGLLEGRVRVAGRDTADHPPRELADVVGVVGQDPLAGFVTDTVEEELAYTMEQLAVPPEAMRARVEEVLDVLGLADLRHRPLADLSGGQQQRVAIGAALTAHPRVLVLDEPTSSLDPVGAEDVLAALTRLVHDLGITVLVVEHRLERVLPYADSLVHVGGEGGVVHGAPADVLPLVHLVPPVVELGRLAGWSPVPLSVRDARRRATALRPRLAPVAGVPAVPERPGAPRDGGLAARGVTVRYGDLLAVRGVDVDAPAGVVTGLMGRNGSGKSSLLWALAGARKRAGGSVAAGPDGADPATRSPAAARRLVALVPQTPTDLLYLDTVGAELARADRDAAEGGRPAREVLDAILPGLADDAHPRDLSAGQQLALVLAVQLSAGPAVLLLDEPTRGLDYRAKAALSRVLRDLAAQGRAVVLATHDVEFAATTCDRVVVLAEGDVVAQGPAQDVLTASPSFAPQVAKVLAPSRYLTVAQVRAELGDDAAPDPAAADRGSSWR
ncbi:ABC transporter ATP-binding protein [Lapillicoccus jejuensis]|uniref:Energy-coupling factor transport system ATP-binding protein n=1 Tax=Lapillicoccus jejuensis TaxID=402171 RepID=A0A542DYA6_9MICO|nr:ABC transporter ATP-binding protein [Lapillicoccus jejuensis]TQJ08039.1 energy-coupling factor transport system ATP-binding protein [Lapillicoccus jejuensis]